MAVRRDITYLNRDFSSLRDQLITFSKTYFPSTYNDFSPASPGMLFMEMAAYVGDILSFYLDNQIQETFVQYAKQTNNLFDLAYMLGYKPKVTSAATTTLTFYQTVPVTTISGVNVPDYTYCLQVPANTIVNSSLSSGTSFTIQDKLDFSYSSSLDPTDVSVYESSNGVPITFLLKKTRQARSGTINTTTFTFGEPIPFNYSDIISANIIGILDVFDSNGNQWYEVDNLAQDAIFDSIQNTNPNDPNYSGNTDTPNLLKIKQVQNRFATRFLNAGALRLLFGAGNPNDTTEVITPNPQNVGLGLPYQQDKLTTAYSPTNFIFTNTFGIAPSNTTLTVRYLAGGGIGSNVQANILTDLDKSGVTFVNSVLSNSSLAQSTFTSLECTNLLAATGGGPGDSVEELRQNSLGNYQNQLRAVTVDDYNIRALSLPPAYGAIAKVYTIKEQVGELTQGETAGNISMYVLSYNNDGTLRIASEALKRNIVTYLSQFRMVGDSIKVKDAFVINIAVEFDIVILPNYVNDEVLTKCIAFIQNYFNINNWQINQPIILKQLFVGLDQIDGVQTVQAINIINKSDIALGYSQYSYDIEAATLNNVVYPSQDPMIFEIKYPNVDIKGRVVPL